MLTGDGQGNFTLESTQPVSTSAQFVAVADVDGDGTDNIVVVDAQNDQIYLLP